MDGKVAIQEHFVAPELEDLVLNPGWTSAPAPSGSTRSTLARSAG
jgi:hypothetical protein